MGRRSDIQSLSRLTGARARRADSAELTVVPTASWTIEQIDLLKRLWSEGLTAAAIAARLGGLSRSAVMGQVHRLRLRTDKAAAASAAKATSAAPGRGETAPARRRRGGQGRKCPPAVPTAVRQHKTLFELSNKTCRWPHGQPGASNFFFCGAPEADLEQGIPYCAQHMRRAYGASASVAAADFAAWTGLRRFPFRFARSAGQGRQRRYR